MYVRYLVFRLCICLIACLLLCFCFSFCKCLFVCSDVDIHIECSSSDPVEDEEDVVERHRADEVEEEPCADVAPGDQAGLQDDGLAVVCRHDASELD